MKTALLTGAAGFVGRNVLPILREHFEVLAPTRVELDLRSGESTKRYLSAHPVDVVYHCANPNPVKNPAEDGSADMVADSLRLFLNLYACGNFYDKMIYLGSGAEYDKRFDICNAGEEDCFRSVPEDAYGLAKYTINTIAAQSDKVYNLCLFGCYGPGDYESKFITHCIRCCLRGEEITIRKDCKFDYIQVSDLGRIMVWMGGALPQYHMYNVSGCEHADLSEIAKEVCRQMGSTKPIRLLSHERNRDYTANGTRLWSECGLKPPMSLSEGIALQIQWEKEHFR